MTTDKSAQEAIENTGDVARSTEQNPPAGPHATEKLTDVSKTPGSGALPAGEEESVTPGSG